MTDRDGRGLPHVAAAAERYRLAREAEDNARRATEEARANLEEVVGSAYRSGAEVEDLRPFLGGLSALWGYLNRQIRELNYP